MMTWSIIMMILPVYAWLISVFLLITVNGAFYFGSIRSCCNNIGTLRTESSTLFLYVMLNCLDNFLYVSNAKLSTVYWVAPSAPYVSRIFCYGFYLTSIDTNTFYCIKENNLTYDNFHFLHPRTWAFAWFFFFFFFFFTFAYEVFHDSLTNEHIFIIYMFQLLQAVCYETRQFWQCQAWSGVIAIYNRFGSNYYFSFSWKHHFVLCNLICCFVLHCILLVIREVVPGLILGCTSLSLGIAKSGNLCVCL